MGPTLSLFIILTSITGPQALALPVKVPIEIPRGSFKPLFGANGVMLEVKAFLLDEAPVTNEEFFRFLAKEKSWQKGKVSLEFTDKNYLSHWPLKGKASAPKRGEEKRPLTSVSWFAASAYCEAKGGRLPSTLEWEYAAAASNDKRDASADAKFQEKVLRWYTTQTPAPGPTGEQEANFYGVRGLHGSIWEWTSDFNAFFVTADNRQDGDQSKNFFCGGAATGAAARDGYPAFMRYALRSSLQANYSLNNLGFRCAYDKIN